MYIKHLTKEEKYSFNKKNISFQKLLCCLETSYSFKINKNKQEKCKKTSSDKMMRFHQNK